MPRNKKRKRMENSNYIFAGHLSSDGYYTPLLFTQREFDVAKKRAEGNPEDLYKDCVVFQQVTDGKPVGEKTPL